MKNQVISIISSFGLFAGLAVSPAVLASDSADLTKSLANSTTLELPAKAADLVAKASAADKQKVAFAVVKMAVQLNPSSTVLIVSAVAQVNPTVAAVAAVSAANLQHRQIDRITKAATAAAPFEAAKIVAALIKSFPQDYGVIAKSAAEGAPSAEKEILAVISECMPALKPYIQAAVANLPANGNVSVSVLAVLSQSYDQAVAAGAQVTSQVPSALLSGVQIPAASAAGQTAGPSTTTLIGATPPGLGGPRLSPPGLSGPTVGPPSTTPPPTTPVFTPNDTQPQDPSTRTYAGP